MKKRDTSLCVCCPLIVIHQIRLAAEQAAEKENCVYIVKKLTLLLLFLYYVYGTGVAAETADVSQLVSVDTASDQQNILYK